MPRNRWVPCALVGLLAIGLHLRTLAFGFVFDDEDLIVRNFFLPQPWSALHAFAHDFWYGSVAYGGYYRPLVTATLAVNGRLFAWSPAGFHLLNVLLHALNSALLFLLARRLGAAGPAAGLAAALFAVHPAAAWPVGSIVARVDLLPATFVLLAWIAWTTPRPGSAAPLFAAVCFLLALLSKESAIAFLIVPLMGLRQTEPRPLTGAPARPPGSRFLACLTVATALLAYLALRRWSGVPMTVERDAVDPLVNPLARLPLPSRLYAALELSGRYLLCLLVPGHFTDPHGYGPASTPPSAADLGVVLSGLLLVAWVLVVLVLWVRRARLAAPLAFSLASFLPASNLVTPIASLYAQNFLYLPLIGFCLALGDLLGRLKWSVEAGEPDVARRRRVAWVAASPLLGLLAIASFREAGIWRDAPTLFSSWAKRFPNYALAHQRLGLALLETGQPAAAAGSFRRALALDDRNVETYDKLSVALLMAAQGRTDLEESLKHNRTAVSLMVRSLSEARTRAAQILIDLDRPTEAEQEAREALRLLQDLAPARAALAESLFRQKRYDEAAAEFKGIVRLQPDDPNARSAYLVSLIDAGDLEEARAQANEARRAFPQLAWFDFCLARIEARSGHKQEALRLLKACVTRDAAARSWIGQVNDFRLYRGEPEFDVLLK